MFDGPVKAGQTILCDVCSLAQSNNSMRHMQSQTYTAIADSEHTGCTGTLCASC